MNLKQHIILPFLFFNMLAFAQMPAAKMLPSDVQVVVEIKAPSNVIWKYLTDLDQLKDYGSAIVKNSTTLGKGRDALREVTFKNGKKRSEEIAVFAPSALKMGIKIVTLNPQMTRNFYYFEIVKDGAYRSKVFMKSYFGVTDKKLKKKYKKEIKKEFEVLLEGLKKHFEQ